MGAPARKLRSLLGLVGSRLQWRLFVALGVMITISSVVSGAIMHLVWGRERIDQEVSRVNTYIGGRFARVWNDPAARDELASSLALQVDMGVVLEAPGGRVLAAYGGDCGGARVQAATVVVEGALAGTVRICFLRRHAGVTAQLLVFLGVALVIVWLASLGLAGRLTARLEELARAAREIGAGNLKARAVLNRRDPGEIITLAETVNDMAARVERQMLDQRELLAAVSHELRTPLGHIRVLTDMARDTGVTARTLDEVDREVNEIDKLVGELLARSRLDFAALMATRLDAAAAARQALERAGEDPARLAVDAPGAAVLADATLLARALANLIDNARRHGGGLAALRVSAADGRVRLAVEDGGHGFAPGDEAKVFEAFYVPAAPRRRHESFGLGLSLVRRIAEAHGGRAWAANLPGGGARVAVELPAALP